jgi:hypothetical protein
VLAAAISCGLGVAELLLPDRNLPRVPPWGALMAPLSGAPIPKGSTVGLLPPSGSSTDYSRFLFLEAAWRRPDLLWVPLEDVPRSSRIALVVSVAGQPAAPGWREAWHAGDLRLLLRIRP